MFSDPYGLIRAYTVLTEDGAVTLSMPASERASDHSTYRAVDGDGNDHSLFIGHNYGRRSRFTARYSIAGITPSLLVPDQNQAFTQSVYVVADVPTSGPIESTGGVGLLFRRHLNAIGGLLVSIEASADPVFRRVVNGET